MTEAVSAANCRGTVIRYDTGNVEKLCGGVTDKTNQLHSFGLLRTHFTTVIDLTKIMSRLFRDFKGLTDKVGKEEQMKCGRNVI